VLNHGDVVCHNSSVPNTHPAADRVLDCLRTTSHETTLNDLSLMSLQLCRQAYHSYCISQHTCWALPLLQISSEIFPSIYCIIISVYSRETPLVKLSLFTIRFFAIASNFGIRCSLYFFL